MTSQHPLLGGRMLVVIPIVNEEVARPLLESLLVSGNSSGIVKQDVLIVDNTRKGLSDNLGFNVYRDPDGHNIGVARAWNIGARQVVEEGREYFVALSSSMLFGPKKETTWVDQMWTFWGADVIESEGHSWHLIAFNRKVFEIVGYFDENFWPGYFEAIDFGYRMRLKGMEGGWTRVWVNALSRGVALSLNDVKFSATPLLDYYADKWGGEKGKEKWLLPWQDKPIDYFPQISIPILAKLYGVEDWW